MEEGGKDKMMYDASSIGTAAQPAYQYVSTIHIC